MPDPATRLAAMKTGKADMHVDMDAEYWDTLDKTAPDMLKASIAGGRGVRLAFRCDIPPFDNVNVRRAMMIGTDVTQHQYVWLASGMNIHYHPITPGHPSYTSLDKLPADIKELYDYNPDKAKKRRSQGHCRYRSLPLQLADPTRCFSIVLCDDGSTELAEVFLPANNR